MGLTACSGRRPIRHLVRLEEFPREAIAGDEVEALLRRVVDALLRVDVLQPDPDFRRDADAQVPLLGRARPGD